MKSKINQKKKRKIVFFTEDQWYYSTSKLFIINIGFSYNVERENGFYSAWMRTKVIFPIFLY